MSDFAQRPYSSHELDDEQDIFVDNPDPRCPVVLLLDTSGSMAGQPIRELNAGLEAFKDALSGDPLASRRVEVAIVSFGPVTADVDFITADRFTPPTLSAGGDTPMGRAIEVALDMLSRRKHVYQRQGVSYYRPWVFLITDGGPTDNWTEAARRVREEEAAKRVAFFAVGTDDADFAKLAKISVREPLRLKGLRFADLFVWLSRSLAAVSQSQPGTQVALPPPSGWNTV